MNSSAHSTSESDSSELMYCIFLHLVEGIGLNRRDGYGDYSERRKEKIILTASLNGVKFEVEGHSTETVTIFNNNCIWECEAGDFKRMKLDNRPVKIEIFISNNSDTRPIGSLLLPIRSLQVVSALKNVQLKLHWHKLNILNSEWRQNKPEIYLLLAAVKKNLIDNGQFEAFLSKKKSMLTDTLSPNASETTFMLTSQSNVYVQLLEQVGLIQVGNDPKIDCDILNVTLTFKQVKNLTKLVDQDPTFNRPNVYIFHYDFLGSASQLEMMVNSSDCYSINEKISLNFKTSLKSLRTYFQRIFYIPITVYLNGLAIVSEFSMCLFLPLFGTIIFYLFRIHFATYRLDFSKLLPDDNFFRTNKSWSKLGTFQLDRLSRTKSVTAPKPSVDFIFGIQLLNSYSKKNFSEMMAYGDNYNFPKADDRSCGDMTECYRNADYSSSTNYNKQVPDDNTPTHNRNYSNFELYERSYMKMQADAALIDRVLEEHELHVNASEDLQDENANSKDSLTSNKNSAQLVNKPSTSLSIDSVKSCNYVVNSTSQPSYNFFESHTYIKKAEHRSIGVNTECEEPDVDELTTKIVQELEDWKSQQMDHFIQGLAEKEELYLVDLEQHWEQKRAILQAKLDSKIARADYLNRELEQTLAELNANSIKHKETCNIVQTVKRDIEVSYAKKFLQLDEEMKRLKEEMTNRCMESEEQHELDQHNILQAEEEKNAAQEIEKVDMKARIEQLEKQLSAMEKTHFSAEQLQGMLDDLRKQTERFSTLEKAKNYYKEQWTKSTRELHKLQIDMLQKEEEALHTNRVQDEDFCLEEILEEEQEALNSDRSELKYIKNLLCDSAESVDELIGD